MLALDWSGRHCVQAESEKAGCAWYHGSWQVLRLLGVFQSIRSDDDFFIPELERLIANGARRVLISGAADYALLARVATASGERLKDMRVTVIDLCGTPLRLNAWYANQLGIEIEVIKGDVLKYQPGPVFDLICTHSFLCFFEQSERQQLLQNWRSCLRPEGRVITAQRARTEDSLPVIAYSEDEITALADRAWRLAKQQFDTLGIDPQLARSVAEGYGRFHWTYLIRTSEEIRELFESQGFELEVFTPPGTEQKLGDNPGTPNQAGSVRWRILARKP